MNLSLVQDIVAGRKIAVSSKYILQPEVVRIFSRNMIKTFNRVIKIDAQNVYEFMAQNGLTDGKETDFICVPPPYEDAYYEFATCDGRHWGVYVCALTQSFPTNMTQEKKLSWIEYTGRPESDFSQPERAVSYYVYSGFPMCADLQNIKNADPIDMPKVCITSGIQADGTPTNYGDETSHIWHTTPENAYDEIMQAIRAVRVAKLTQQFMACKNVNIYESSGPSKRMKVVSGMAVPFVRFKTLNITPMAKIIRRSETPCDATKMYSPLHSCRGHFKDYRRRGLFGKNRGMYWWGDHLRGDAKNGEVVKDYKVNPPPTEL